MLVSIITPSFNQGQFLEETILSVLNQDFNNIEYIIIDGGSSDHSKEIINKHSDKISYWVSEPDRGQADAINKGFLKANGDFICWINSDDILYPHFVSTRVRQFSENPDVDFIYGDVDQGIDILHKVLRKGAQIDFMNMLINLHVPIPQQSAMWRRIVLDKIGLLNPQWRVLLDREFFMRIAQQTKILYQSGTVAFFRNHENSKSVSEWRKWADELDVYYNDLFSGILTHEYIILKTQTLSKMYFQCAMICNDCNDSKGMKEYLTLSKEMNLSTYYKQQLNNGLRKFKHKITNWSKRSYYIK